MAGERIWTVDPLPTGPEEVFDSDLVLEELAEIPAVALFVARTTAADASFVLDEATAPLVVEICRRLDGIPLAIELAAARARAIGVAEVAHRLDQRFAVLKAMRRGERPTPPDHARRHQLVVRHARARRARAVHRAVGVRRLLRPPLGRGAVLLGATPSTCSRGSPSAPC